MINFMITFDSVCLLPVFIISSYTSLDPSYSMAIGFLISFLSVMTAGLRSDPNDCLLRNLYMCIEPE